MTGGTGTGRSGGTGAGAPPHDPDNPAPYDPDGAQGARGNHGSRDGGGPGAPDGDPVVPAGERGATRIADRVVAKVAAQAAREAVGPLPEDAVPPHATVVIRPQAQGPGQAPAEAAHIRLYLELGYPVDIGARCRAVRRHVAERVGALVGMEVPEVAVEVERLHPPTGRGAQGRTR
ncbi:Asp23/Gls24 family envelope stress response protein [Streptomyces sp. NPDC004610]|uniref:Asp23/Gls24 family envelope stress response protein n=1 Tax=unclassified Streptomyces TaxID=2593676 RepID=UPI0033BE72A4